MYNNYLVTKYSLRKDLKPLRKEKDQKEENIKEKLDEYHSIKIKGYVSANFVPTATEMQN